LSFWSWLVNAIVVNPSLPVTTPNEVQIGQAGYSGRDLVESGKLRAIAIAGSQLPAFNVPTTAEVG
jgi:hypothetical protein